MNKYYTVSTEFLEDKIIGGKLNAREFLWFVINMMTFTFLNPVIDDLLIIAIILLPINVVAYFVLKKKYKKSYLEKYILKKINKVNVTVIHKIKIEDEWEKENKSDDVIIDQTKINI